MIFSLLLGLGTAPSIALFAPYLGDLFGRANLGFLFAVVTAGWGVVGGWGPMVWGIIHDNTGNYDPALLVSAGCFGLALLALLLMRASRK